MFKIYVNIILPVFLHAFENWSFALREEHRLRGFQNRVLRKLLGPQRNGVTDEWMDSTTVSIVSSTSHLISFGRSNQEEWERWGTWQVSGRRNVHAVYWWGKMRNRNQLEDLWLDCSIILKWILKKEDGGILMWPRYLKEAPSYERCNETSGCIECKGLSWLASFSKDSVPWIYLSIYLFIYIFISPT